MKCTLNISREMIKDERPVAYKYAIHSPNFKKVAKKSYPWEYLHQTSSWVKGPVNRCLQVPRDNKGEIIYLDCFTFSPLSLENVWVAFC